MLRSKWSFIQGSEDVGDEDKDGDEDVKFQKLLGRRRPAEAWFHCSYRLDFSQKSDFSWPNWKFRYHGPFVGLRAIPIQKYFSPKSGFSINSFLNENFKKCIKISPKCIMSPNISTDFYGISSSCNLHFQSMIFLSRIFQRKSPNQSRWNWSVSGLKVKLRKYKCRFKYRFYYCWSWSRYQCGIFLYPVTGCGNISWN